MRLAELGELIAVNPVGDPWFDADILFPDPRDLLDIFSGLLQVEVNVSERSVVRLAHFSVKEYLISERIKAQQPQKFWLPELQSHELIAATCLACILHFQDNHHLFKNPGTIHLKLLEKDSLMGYAFWNWDWHARIAGSHQGVLRDLVLEFLRRSDLRKVWFLRFSDVKSLPSREERLECIPPLFIAASLGIVGIVKSLLDSGHDVNERCALGTALETAVMKSHNTVLRILLENGADPNLLGGDNNPPLHVAARFGTVESFKILIDSGAEMHDERGEFGSPLIAACLSSGNRPVADTPAEYLLDKGANIHISSNKYGNALHAACAQSVANIALIRKLVSRGVVIDARGGEYGTALQAACAYSRNDQVIRFLLSQADPCIEVKESKYGTALQAVCAESHDNDKIVKLLLDHGAKKTSRSGKYGTALHAACFRGNGKIVRLLLKEQCSENSIVADQNLDVNEVTAQYGTPLHAACSGQRELVIRFLVDLGANINANIPEIGTPLHQLCDRKIFIFNERGMARIAAFLMRKGADINIRRDRRPYTALEILLQKLPKLGNLKIIDMLYKQSVVETGLSKKDAIRLKRVKRVLGISTGEEISDRGRDIAAETSSSDLSSSDLSSSELSISSEINMAMAALRLS